jgi:hypothetical protein
VQTRRHFHASFAKLIDAVESRIDSIQCLSLAAAVVISNRGNAGKEAVKRISKPGNAGKEAVKRISNRGNAGKESAKREKRNLDGDASSLTWIVYVMFLMRISAFIQISN